VLNVSFATDREERLYWTTDTGGYASDYKTTDPDCDELVT